MANDRGGHDNITVQLVRVLSTGTKRTNPGASPTMTEGQAMQAQSAGHLGQPRAGQPHVAPGGADLAMRPPMTPAPAGVAPAPTTVPQHMGSMTIPMQPSPTAHDGTSRASHAAAAMHAPSAGSHALPPTQMSMPTAPGADAGLAGYRLDGAGALPLPPQSMRQGAAHTPTMTPAMTPQPAPSYGGSPGVPVPAPSWPGGPTSADAQGGGKVLVLVLAGSFVVACLALLVVWAAFLR
jgi:protein phosphatase